LNKRSIMSCCSFNEFDISMFAAIQQRYLN
jgi:hypothetical protein